MSTRFPTFVRCAALAAACALPCGAIAQPANNTCASAQQHPLTAGVRYDGTAANATADALSDSTCTFEPGGADVYHTFTTTGAGVYIFDLCGAGTNWDTVLSLHSGCPATIDNQIACADDGCDVGPPGGPSRLVTVLPANTAVVVRIVAWDAVFVVPGPYSVLVTAPATPVGRCCNAGGCTVSTEAACVSGGGTYGGDNLTCFPPQGSATAYPGTGGNIPDNNPAGLSSSVTVADAFTVGGVEVQATLVHTWIGDLTVQLTKGTTTFTLFSRVGDGPDGDDSNLNGTYLFADTASTTITAGAASVSGAQVVPPGPYRTVDDFGQATFLNVPFAGVASDGQWTLKVVDGRAAQIGSLTNWSLRLIPSGANPCPTVATGACCTGLNSTTCQILDASACATAGGAFRGSGTTCDGTPGNQITCCTANFNRVGGVSVQDLYDYFSDWNAQVNGQPPFLFSADVNESGTVTVQDIYDFLEFWVEGCVN